MQSFFKVKTIEQIYESLKDIKAVGIETVPLVTSLGRVLAQDITSRENLPGFQRSTMDGYAVIARDTFGAGESLPSPFKIIGEIKMGEMPGFAIKRGECASISTGGMLPEGADAVVMVEYSQIIESNIVELNRPVSPLENIILPDDDVKAGQTILYSGRKLRPQDLGILAALGVSDIDVFVRPKAAIISTGEEVVDIRQTPKTGQVRDVNSYTLGGLCLKSGAEPLYLGITGDNFDDLKSSVQEGLSRADVVLLSGGSSVGIKDFTLDAFLSFEGVELLAHGISVSPGKPTIIAQKGNKTLWGLPGHPVSAMIIFDVLLKHLFSRLSGLSKNDEYFSHEIDAELDRNIESANGREDYIRVKLIKRGDTLLAQPVPGKSGLISTMVDADGIIRVDMNTEGLYKCEKVKVRLF